MLIISVCKIVAVLVLLLFRPLSLLNLQSLWKLFLIKRFIWLCMYQMIITLWLRLLKHYLSHFHQFIILFMMILKVIKLLFLMMKIIEICLKWKPSWMENHLKFSLFHNKVKIRVSLKSSIILRRVSLSLMLNLIGVFTLLLKRRVTEVMMEISWKATEVILVRSKILLVRVKKKKIILRLLDLIMVLLILLLNIVKKSDIEHKLKMILLSLRAKRKDFIKKFSLNKCI